MDLAKLSDQPDRFRLRRTEIPGRARFEDIQGQLAKRSQSFGAAILAGPLGAVGGSGQVDTHFWRRFGGAILLSILGDAGEFAECRDVSFNQPTQPEANQAAQRSDFHRLEPFEVELLDLKRQGRIREFLIRCVELKRNIVVAGKTGSGKTTLTRSLIEAVPLDEHIATIEDVHELFLPNHREVTHLFHGEGSGGITTTHANGAIEAFDRIATLIKNSPVGRTLEMVEIKHVLYTTIDVRKRLW